ncbi:hypothetical protein [Micromonospora sp. DT62]|uniref:hypothetical protein n=1 Tax=Micromonospora sp. DT62 TaxID=3416521 RepID=UPI003CF13DB6
MSISLDILVTVMIKRSHGGAMADDAAVPMAAPDAEGLPDTVAAGLQSQIDDLTAALEHHQRLFESLRAHGLLPTDPDDGRP